MAEGVDYAFPPLPSAAGLAANGKTFAGRYVGPGSGKFLTPQERDALFANGIDIFLLVEGEADSARGGRPVGQQHAQLALDHALSLGAPVALGLIAFYFAVDYDLATSDWLTAREYLAGACDVLGVARVGVYGEHDVMMWASRDGVASWFFQTYAWSYGQWFAGNHVEQYLNGQTVAGGDVDLCRSKQADFGQWTAEGDMTSLDDTHTGPDGYKRTFAQILGDLHDHLFFGKWGGGDNQPASDKVFTDSVQARVQELLSRPAGEPGPAGPPGPPGPKGDAAVIAAGTQLTVTE